MDVRALALCAAAAWLLAGGAAAAAQDAEPPGPAVKAALQTCRELTIFDHVTARVENGAVVLSGRVTNDAKKARVERRIAETAGVTEMRNEIAVLPASPADDDLRYRVSRAIYGHPAFWSYAAMPRPPIHIVVENDTVTLAGVVGTEVERAMAGSLAGGHGRRPVINQLTIGR